MSIKTAPAPKEVQDFLFKKVNNHELSEKFDSVPLNCNLLAADGKRGLLYLGHQKFISVAKLGNEGNLEWKLDHNFPDSVSKLTLNCDASLVAVSLSAPSVLIYSAASLCKNELDLLYEIRLSSSSGDISVFDVRWNPAVPGMLCTVASDHTIGSFLVNPDKKAGFTITGTERIQGVEALCAAWSPKGKQIVVGCRNGNIIQLKPELKPARSIAGPNPSIGSVVAILWVSNFQFCAAYQEPGEQRVNVLIVDAPKGETVARFTNYEDITYGGIPTTRYYFEYIPEWGVILAASSTSCEVAVLGTIDNGVTWEQWQLDGSSRAEIPLVRAEESFPVGLAIDKSSTVNIALTAETILPNPVPILHIFGTSGRLCSFHVINLKPGCPAICVPPSEFVPAPQTPVNMPAPRPNMGSSEISFNLPAGVTSTPRPKMDSPKEKPKNVIMTNFFADSAKPSFPAKVEPEKQIMNPPALPKIETKTFVQQTEPKAPIFEPPVEIKIPKPRVEKQTKPEVPETVLQRLQKEVPVKEPIQEKPNIDDSLCIRAYREEQINFEKELKTRLEPLIWECGTNAEKEQLVEKTALIDEFLRDLQETTTGLASDIAYLKGLLLQSFAWLEETKSKNSENGKLNTRNRKENSKLVELQKLYYYTQSQLVQVSKVLDLQWSDQQTKEQKKINIPSMECIYQSLMRHGQILMKEKHNMENLTRKWKSIARGNTVSDLNRSISNLQISSMNSSHFGNDSAIDLRCRAIANKSMNFSREKQMKLRDLLSESTPRIIKPAKPTLIQDRLEATLSSLASMSPTKVTKPKSGQRLTPSQKPKMPSPLASLNNIVSKIGIQNDKLESTEAAAPKNVSPLAAQKPKQTMSISFNQTSQNLVKPFPKVDSISFGPKSDEKNAVKVGKSGIEKESTLGKTPDVALSQTPAINFSSKQGSNVPTTPTIQSTFSLQTSVPSNPPATSIPAQSFSFASKPASNLTAFSFASKPEEKSNLDLGGLNLSQSGITITPISEPKPSSTNQPSPAMSSINFGKLPATIFAAPGTNTFGTPGSNAFGTCGSSTFATPGSNIFTSPGNNTIASSASNAFGTSVSNTFATSGTNAFGTSGTNTSATSGASTFATPGANTFGASPTSTFANSGSLFGKGNTQGSIFGGNTTFSLTGNTAPNGIFSNSTPSMPALSSITISSANSASTTVPNSTVTSSTPALNPLTISGSNAPSNTTSSVIVPKPASISSPILASTLFQSPSSVSTPGSGSLSTSIATPNSDPATGFVTSPGSGSITPASAATPNSVASPGSIFSPNSATSQSSPSSFPNSASSPNSVFSLSSIPSPNSALSSANSVPVSNPPPSYGSAVAAAATSSLDMLPLSLSSSKPVTTTAGNAFQTPATTSSSIFSTPFGAVSSAASTLNFGTAVSISPSPMIAPAFGKDPSTPGSIFGGSTAPAGNVFGNAAPSPNANPFGGNTLAQSPSSTSIFGNAANSTTGGSIFGGGSTTGTAFGMKPTPTTNASVFGMPAQTSVFGGATNTSLFGGGAAKPQEGNFSMFGGSTSATGTGNVFGQAPAFGTKPTFGGTADFGQPKSVFGSGFGAPATFGSPTASPGFGSPPMMGGSPPPLGGAPMQKVFGGSTNNTFESLANQSGGLSFSSLAQGSPEQQQQQQQHLQKPPEFAAKSSFSSWR